MQEKISLIRFPALLLVLFFVGKLIVGAAGGSYELWGSGFLPWCRSPYIFAWPGALCPDACGDTV